MHIPSLRLYFISMGIKWRAGAKFSATYRNYSKNMMAMGRDR
jgi:hypothetical protein